MDVPPIIETVSCTFDLTWFPFDEHRCKIKYGSWTSDLSLVSVIQRF